MKRVCLALALCFGCFCLGSLSLAAQDRSFSLELGYGYMPIHAQLAPTRQEELALADKGMSIDGADYHPTVSITQVWRTSRRWELCLTEGFSWCIFPVKRYDTFGVDPNGKPRYNLKSGVPGGYRWSLPAVSATFQARFIWSPDWAVKLYSAVGVGLSTHTIYYPLPSITPIALRFGNGHFYGFAEATLGPIATFGQGGIGWKF